MNILVTGGTGFVGENLTKKLLNKSNKLRCLVRKSSITENLQKFGVEIIEGDISNYNSLDKATKNIDIVYHCAALVTDWAPINEFVRINLDGTRNLIEESIKNKVKKFIYISSNDAIWSFNDHNDLTEEHPYPINYLHPYCKTKAEAEKIVLYFSKLKKINSIIIRPYLVWGPGDRVILPRIVQLALRGDLPIIGNRKNKV